MDPLDNQQSQPGLPKTTVLPRQPASVNQLRKLFDQQPDPSNSSIAGTALRPRRPTMDGLNPVRKRHGSLSHPGEEDEQDELDETPQNSPIGRPASLSSGRPATYGVRNFPPRGTPQPAPVQRGFDDDEERRRFDQEVYEFEEQKKQFNNNFSRFLQKKEEFLDKVEQFESDKDTFEHEKRKFEFTKQSLEEERKQLEIQKQHLASEKAMIAQKMEAINKEQQDLLAKRQAFESEKKNTLLEMASSQTKPQEIDQLTTKINDMATQIETQNQTHLVLQQVIDSLTLQLQQETESGEKSRAELENLKSTNSRSQQQSVMMLEELSNTQKEWKKKEKKLQSQIKAYKEGMEHFIQEREQLNRDRENFEKTKLSLVEAETVTATLKEEKWEDKAWVQQETRKLAQDRQKVAVIKRYTETERLRVGELKKRIEAEQLSNDLLHKELAQLRANQLATNDPLKKRSKSSSKTSAKSVTKARLNLQDELKTNTFDQTELSPRKAESAPGSPTPNKSEKPRKSTASKTAKKVSVEKRDDHAASSSDPVEARVEKAEPQVPEGPPGDVFQIAHLPVMTVKPDIVAKIFMKGEEEDFKTLQVENDGLVTRASLRCCLRRIAALPDDYDFHFTFFTIHDYFIDSVTLFKTLILLYRSGLTPAITRHANNLITPQNTQETKILETQILHKYQDRIIEALIMWMGFRFENLTPNEEFRTLLVQFLLYLNHPSINTSHGADLRKAWNYLEEMCKQFNDGKALLFKLSSGPPNGLTILQIDSKTMADQLTLEEQASFQNIELTDYYQKSWETNPNNNISKMMTRFDMMVDWFVSLILTAPNDIEPKERAKVLSKLIEIMAELKNLRNFNSVMQIFNALNCENVQKLKKAWSLVPKNDIALLQKVGQFMSPNNKFGVYRAYLDEIEENSPCIPYHTLLLRDLHVIEGLTPLYDENGRIHFDTMAMLADVFYRLQDFRSVLYSLEEDSKIQIFLSNKVILSKADMEPLTNEGVKSSPKPTGSGSSSNLTANKAHSKSPRNKDTVEPKVSRKKSTQALKGDAETLWRSLVPGIGHSPNFAKWLSKDQEKWMFECWEKLVVFKQTDFGSSAMGYITWQETGEDIIATYFARESPYFIHHNFDELDTIVDGFISSGQIMPNLVDPLIDYCAQLLTPSWKEFISEL